MNHGSVFSGGAAGFDEAAKRVGWTNVFNCEIDPYCRKTLKKNHPETIQHGDITTTDFAVYRGIVDVLTGGWPCQDNSRASQHGTGQQGLQGARSGLFYQNTRAIREIRPNFFVGENVPELLTVNGGRDFNFILSDLAAMGYNVTWGVLRASDVGAPHIRERLYLVAYSRSFRLQTLRAIWENVGAKIDKGYRDIAGAVVQVGGAWRQTESVFLRMDDGIQNRSQRIKMMGNAIVPEIAYHIFEAINDCVKSAV